MPQLLSCGYGPIAGRMGRIVSRASWRGACDFAGSWCDELIATSVSQPCTAAPSENSAISREPVAVRDIFAKRCGPEAAADGINWNQRHLISSLVSAPEACPWKRFHRRRMDGPATSPINRRTLKHNRARRRRPEIHHLMVGERPNNRVKQVASARIGVTAEVSGSCRGTGDQNGPGRRSPARSDSRDRVSVYIARLEACCRK